MAGNSRGPPPKPTPLDPAVAKDIQTRLTPYVMRSQLTDATNKARNNDIVDANSAREYLEGSLWIAKDAPFSRAELFSVLVKMSMLPQATLKLMAHTLRALAFIGEMIDGEVAQEVANVCGPAVGEAIAPVIEKLQGAVEDMTSKSSMALVAAETTKEEVLALKEQIGELRRSVEEARTAAEAAAAEAQVAARAPASAPRSYAAAASAAHPMTSEQAALVARDARMRRQILVDKAKEATVDALSLLMELELKEKANLALTLMPSKREGAMFVGAKKLGSGGGRL
ncbi:hypothetical protein K438DRAFT_1753839 [Mycena galopus ATCC 62051]|nr:hypothetical protein K438DRAFT_1753839 [Mycena galopus ATCC 62051]